MRSLEQIGVIRAAYKIEDKTVLLAEFNIGRDGLQKEINIS